MTTCHANTPRDALKRIETMALMADLKIPHRVIREQVSSAVQIIVQLTRTHSGHRRVCSIVEVDRLEGEQILTQDLFKTVKTDKGEILQSTGLLPIFLQNTEFNYL
jgi:pilus assembly protein CpaF